jgi:Ni,Fe-hydrogenase I small subunit
MTANEYLRQNVVLRPARSGEACLACDDPFEEDGDPAISVTVEIPALLTTVKMEKPLHPACAKALRDRLDSLLKQIRRPR